MAAREMYQALHLIQNKNKNKLMLGNNYIFYLNNMIKRTPTLLPRQIFFDP